MMLSRRKFLSLSMVAVTFPAVLQNASGQASPLGPVRLIVGHPAGGPTDIVARLFGQ